MTLWLAVLGLVVTAALPALARGDAYGNAYGIGPAYAPSTPHPGALYRDGQTGRYLLDGQWLYQADSSDSGITHGLWKDVSDTTGWSAVAVPNAYNAGDFSSASMTGSVGWYRKDFLLPRGLAGRHWLIRFESINYRARVWLNGYPLGSHAGAYIAFELDLAHLRPGVNRLIVRVDDRRLPSDIPAGPGGGWWNYGGIVREVYLRAVDRADLAQVAVTPLLPCRTCAATVKERALVRNVTGKPQTVTLRGSFGGTPINFGTAKIPPHSTWIAEAMVTIRHPRLWSIYRPELYRATLTLYGPKGARMAGYLTFSGIRSITLSPNGQLELNYLPLHLRGAFIHESDAALGSALDSAHRLRLVGWLRQLGGHLIRSHYPLHPQILELADEYGILVWSEIPVNHELSSYLGNPAVSAQARQMLQQSILTNGNHPSVMAWSIGNELAAPITGDEGRYIAAAAAVVRSLDPTRPVALAINDWPGLGCQSAYAPVDVLGFNDYFGWFEAGGGTTDDREGLGPFLDQLHDCYPHKALLVTEFGFDANRDGPVEERGTYAFQADSAAYHLSVFAQKPWLSGAVYFTLQEFAANPGYAGGNPLPDSVFNHKGLVDINGNAKPAFGTVASIYKATVQQGS